MGCDETFTTSKILKIFSWLDVNTFYTKSDSLYSTHSGWMTPYDKTFWSTLAQVKGQTLPTLCFWNLDNIGTSFSEIWIKSKENACKKVYLKVYMFQWYRSSGVHIMIYCLIGTKSLSNSMITYILDPMEWIAVKKYQLEMSEKCMPFSHSFNELKPFMMYVSLIIKCLCIFLHHKLGWCAQLSGPPAASSIM